MVCWPRLWLLLPSDVKEEIAAARRALDTAVELLIWSGLAAVWLAFTWWPAIVVVAATAFSYWLAVRAAVTYGDLFEAAFDIHRFTLFQALGMPLNGAPARSATRARPCPASYYADP